MANDLRPRNALTSIWTGSSTGRLSLPGDIRSVTCEHTAPCQVFPDRQIIALGIECDPFHDLQIFSLCQVFPDRQILALGINYRPISTVLDRLVGVHRSRGIVFPAIRYPKSFAFSSSRGLLCDYKSCRCDAYSRYGSRSGFSGNETGVGVASS